MSGPAVEPQRQARLGPYELVKELKSGGMARLYIGRREGPGGFSRYLAIKTVHAHLAHDEGFIQMFLDEARLAAQLSHPNIVQVEDLGEVDGVYFMAMELVRGVSFFQVLKAASRSQSPIPPRVAVRVGMEVAAGLHAAHTAIGNDGRALGVVHRDVSPQNIMVSWSGQVKLLDFGIAKAHGTQTSGDTLKGKLRYMPPEQARGRIVDARADQYALGVVLWEGVTSRRRFRGDNDFELLEAVRSPERCSAQEAGAPISDALDAVINKALAANPDDRYPSARDFREALRGTPEADMTRDELGAYLSERLQDEREDQRQEMPVSSPSISRARSVEPPQIPAAEKEEAARPDRRRMVIASTVITACVLLGIWVGASASTVDVPDTNAVRSAATASANTAPSENAVPSPNAEEPEAPAAVPMPIEGSVDGPSRRVALPLGAQTTLLHGEQADAGEVELTLIEVLDGSVRVSVDGEEAPLAQAEALTLPQGELFLLWADYTTGAARFDFRPPRGASRGRSRAAMMSVTMTRMESTMETTQAMSESPPDDFSAGLFEGRMRALPVQDL